MANKNNTMDNLLTDDEYSRINGMVKNFKESDRLELEVSFKHIDYTNFMRISEHYVNLVNEANISTQDSLDISIMLPNGDTYRVSIINTDKIDQFIQKFTKARIQDIHKFLLGLNSDSDYEIMFKNRGAADRLYIDEIGAVFKATEETPVTKSTAKPKLSGTEKMLYRYKNRYSFVLNKNVRIDITNVQESPEIWNLTSKPSNYEIEAEVINKKITTESLFDEVVDVLKVVQNSDIPIGKTEEKRVVQNYRDLLESRSNHLESRNVISLEAQHIVKFIPNRYAFTDKADGERYFLFIMDDSTYLLTTNLVVRKLNLKIKNKSKFNNTILDGEFVDNENGRMFLAFEVVYADNINYSHNTKYTLTNRISILNNIIDECFGTLIPFADYTEKHSDLELSKIKSFYTKELKTYWASFWTHLKKTNGPFITRKLYFFPYGIDSCEIFMYADMIWKLYVYSKLIPYKLDGGLYTPINIPYMLKVRPENLDAVPLEYKWKPPNLNSIDFYVIFEKDSNGYEAVYYDNTVVRGEGKPYKICQLHVGIHQGTQEKPVPFKVGGINQKANIYLTDGEARDIEGNVISDKTVVEFIFDMNQTEIDDSYKWIALKTRYDKTESVQKYKKKYGNNLNIASRIWKTIVNPITEETIASLGNPSTFQKEMDRLSKSSDSYNKQSDIYYEKETRDASGMRAFHNWIKSNMIQTYCFGKTVLDIGCGRGGDLYKFLNAQILEYVGVDIDNNGLYVINQSAFNKYKQIRRSNSNVPPMRFINADARGIFDVKSQEKILPNMIDANKKLIETYLSGNKQYDVINCQFTLHYYLSDKLSWNNFCKNINNHLKTNGYILITCFDGKLLYDKLFGKQKLNVSYTDNMGNKKTFFEIIKIYSDDEEPGVGMAIDLHNSLISNPGKYIREYLVFPEFLKQSLKKNCGLELVETDLFFNLFHLYKNYFLQGDSANAATGDKKRDTLLPGIDLSLANVSAKKYKDIRNFYLSLSPNTHSDVEVDAAMASFKFSSLNRYYIFKKTKQVDITEPSRIVGFNQKINLGKFLMPYFSTNNMIIDPSKKTSKINDIYHSLRKTHRDTKPSVYLIRHTIPEDGVNGEIYKRNKLEFSRIKEGPDDKVLLIYKSPDRYFYPIRYQPLVYPDDDSEQLSRSKSSNTYLLNSGKITDDLDALVSLSEKKTKM